MNRRAWRAAIAALTAGAAHACAGKVQTSGESVAAGPERPASDGGGHDAAPGVPPLPAEDAARVEDCTLPNRRDWREVAFREDRIPPEDACRGAEKPYCYTSETGCPMPPVCDSDTRAYSCDERMLICSCVNCRLPLPELDCSWILGRGRRDTLRFTQVIITDSCQFEEVLSMVESEAACGNQRAWYVTELVDEAQPDRPEELRERQRFTLCPAACEEHRAGANRHFEIVLDRTPCMCR